MILAMSKALGRQIILSMPNESEECPNTIKVTEVELDHCIFHMEFHTILQESELCHNVPDGVIWKKRNFVRCAYVI